jgi:septal ring factor EnvC (AmiA/AmiB activator)
MMKEIEKKKKQQRNLKKKEKSLLDQLDDLARLENRKNKELEGLQRELSQNEGALATHEKEMNGLSDQMAATQKQLEKRVGALYRFSKVGPWAFFFSGESYGDFLRMSNALYTMVNRDVDLFKDYESQFTKREALKRKLAVTRERLEKSEQETRLKKREVEQLQKKQKNALKKVKEKKASYEKVIKDLEKQARKLASLLEELSKEQKVESIKAYGFSKRRGSLQLPVSGKIEKKRVSGLRGISIKAARGALVRAVHRGRVVYAGWFKGFGNLIIIDHGEEYRTVMGNASELLKAKGDWVEAGDSVAKVGDSGSLGGTSLYFEIRKGTAPVDPLKWFSREARLALR